MAHRKNINIVAIRNLDNVNMKDMRDRLTRIFLLGLAAFLIIALAKGLADWQGQQRVAGESVSLPQVSVKEKLEDLGEDILGKTVEFLPGAPDLGVDQADQETEPIEEPVENVQQQTQALIEAIKKLPEDQIEAIKKQIYEEFCEGALKE